MNKIHDELKVDACTTIQCLFFNIPLIHRQVHDKQQPRSPFSRVLVFLFLIYGVLCTALNQNNRLTDAGNYTHRIRIKKESFIQSFPFSNNCFRKSAFLLVMLEYGVYSLSFFSWHYCSFAWLFFEEGEPFQFVTWHINHNFVANSFPFCFRRHLAKQIQNRIIGFRFERKKNIHTSCGFML